MFIQFVNAWLKSGLPASLLLFIFTFPDDLYFDWHWSVIVGFGLLLGGITFVWEEIKRRKT